MNKPRKNDDQLGLFKTEPSEQSRQRAKADLTLRAPYARGSDTSKAAAESIEPTAGTLRAKVLELIASRGSAGMTCDEVEQVTELVHQTASARVHELMKLGAIVDSGQRRKTRSGRNATVWVASGQTA